MSDPVVRRIHSAAEAPANSYLLYNLNGGIFCVQPKDFPCFVLKWVGYVQLPPLSMDLASAGCHALVLDLDVTPEGGSIPSHPPEEVFDRIQNVLKTTFLPLVPHFTYIVARRRNGAGLHVHLPEFVIGYDDYVLLCESLRPRLDATFRKVGSYALDVLRNAMLAGASKPGTEPYEPDRLIYVDEKRTDTFRVRTDSLSAMKKAFKRRKENDKSLFRYLLNSTDKMFPLQLRQVMMPVVTGYRPAYDVLYETGIGTILADSPDWTTVAYFTYKTKDSGYISKKKQLLLNGSHMLRVYHYLKLNAWRIADLTTNNAAVKAWYRTFRREEESMPIQHVPERFRDVHRMLLQENPQFLEDPNPIQTILQYNHGYYFLPVFYALYNHCRVSRSDLIRDLYQVVDPEFYPLLQRLQDLDEKTIRYAVSDLTLNTLHFCGNHLYERPRTMREKLKGIVENHRVAILSVATHEQMVALLRSLQEKHFPILHLRLRNALKKANTYIWNFLTESWQEIGQAGEIADHVTNLWSSIKAFLVQYRASGGLAGPDATVVEKFNVSTVVASIHSDTKMERKDVQMDMHKWFVRLSDGTLDLLTGHVGGVVPEFFLSDRKLGVDGNRMDLMRLCNTEPDLNGLYVYLTSKSVFLKYLKQLFLNQTDDVYRTLEQMVLEDIPQVLVHPVARSMLHFYVHLCKYMSFEYEMILYLMHVLASVLIATNYERKFFVLKGLTRNGKSKLFELMGRVLGGYYHSIQSENLTPSKASNNATPELASTLFSCRMVASEELEGKLNENRVKQITGNSFVTFRNMYEQNMGGIPTAKVFVTTNNYPECRASVAFKDRVVAIPFDADFVDKAPATTAEQVGKNTYAKDAYVVEESYQGCFLMLYYHLRRHIDPEDGLLHYPPEPEYVVEFTRDYLIHADIYVQFKVEMDVQKMKGCLTTMNDLKSAVRQFLKATRNTSFHETDLFIRFEEEFGEYRRTDVQFGSFGSVGVAECGNPNPLQFVGKSLLLEGDPLREEGDEPPTKRARREEAGGGEPSTPPIGREEGSTSTPPIGRVEGLMSLVYYEDVVIKNLKRTFLDAA